MRRDDQRPNPRRGDEALRRRVEKIMQDRSYDRLRVAGARRALAVATGAALVAVLVMHVLWGPTVGLAAVVAVGLLVLLLKISLRSVADLPEEYLDERQSHVRNRAYTQAYRWLASGISVLAAAGLIAFVVRSGTPDLWTVDLTIGQYFGVCWLLILSAIALPSLVLALSEEERREPELSPAPRTSQQT